MLLGCVCVDLYIDYFNLYHLSVQLYIILVLNKTDAITLLIMRLYNYIIDGAYHTCLRTYEKDFHIKCKIV